MPVETEEPGPKSVKDIDCIEVTGCLSRADWEVLYLKTRELARRHGLKVRLFKLQPAELGEPKGESKGVVDTQEATADLE